MIRELAAVIVLGSVLGLTKPAIAHGIVLRHQQTQAIQISASYDSGEPMANAQVIVFSPKNPSTPFLTSTADSQGKFAFVPDQSGTWQVQVRQAGHGDILIVNVAPTPVAQSAAESAPSPAPDTALDAAAPKAEATATAIAASPTTPDLSPSNRSGLSPLQHAVILGSVVWGCLGTALFFKRGKR